MSAPHVLMQFAIDDTVVPNRTSQAYAAALGLELLGEALLPMPGVTTGPPLPTADNLEVEAAGTITRVTAGVFQYDVVWVDSGPDLQGATHQNVADNPVTVHQSTHFLSTYLQGISSEVLDPYTELGIK